MKKIKFSEHLQTKIAKFSACQNLYK